jgi:hypothetical protein
LRASSEGVWELEVAHVVGAAEAVQVIVVHRPGRRQEESKARAEGLRHVSAVRCAVRGPRCRARTARRGPRTPAAAGRWATARAAARRPQRLAQRRDCRVQGASAQIQTPFSRPGRTRRSSCPRRRRRAGRGRRPVLRRRREAARATLWRAATAQRSGTRQAAEQARAQRRRTPRAAGGRARGRGGAAARPAQHARCATWAQAGSRRDSGAARCGAHATAARRRGRVYTRVLTSAHTQWLLTFPFPVRPLSLCNACAAARHGGLWHYVRLRALHGSARAERGSAGSRRRCVWRRRKPKRRRRAGRRVPLAPVRSAAALTPADATQMDYMLERNRGALPRWTEERFLMVRP